MAHNTLLSPPPSELSVLQLPATNVVVNILHGENVVWTGVGREKGVFGLVGLEPPRTLYNLLLCAENILNVETLVQGLLHRTAGRVGSVRFNAVRE